jgi:hypothetical protein
MSKFLTAFFVFILSTNAFATTYKDYNDVLSTALNAVTEYSMFVFSEGDKKYLLQANKNQKDILTLPAYVNHPNLQTAWKAVNKSLQYNLTDIVNQGYADLRQEYKMHHDLEQFITAVTALQGIWLKNNPDAQSKSLQLAYDAQITILRINCQYVAHSAAVDINLSAIGNLDVGLKTLIPQFSTQLTELDAFIKPENKKDLRKIKSKWGFLQKPLSNITESNIAYLAYKTSLSINEHLQLIADSQNK